MGRVCIHCGEAAGHVTSKCNKMRTRLYFQPSVYFGKSVEGLMEKAFVEKCCSYSYLQDLNSRNKLITQY